MHAQQNLVSNILIGHRTAYDGPFRNAEKNVVVGNYAGYWLTNDDKENTLIGQQAGQFLQGGTSGNVFIGFKAGGPTGSAWGNGSNALESNVVVIGDRAVALGSNEITFGNPDSNRLRIPGIGLDVTSGLIDLQNDGTTESEMRLYCASSNSHYAGIKAPAHGNFTGNLTFRIPGSYGSNGQVLQSDGLGGTSWTTPATGSTYTASSGLNLSGSAFSIAYGNAASTEVRKITTSTSAPSGGTDGDIWIKYV